jgi:DNA-binding transcriptional ArsR family regulator
MDKADLLLHPVRMRILRAFPSGKTRTTSELIASLPDVSQATVYRHVAILADHGILRASERRGGGRERCYELRRELATIDQDVARRMSNDDHLRTFTNAMVALLADFEKYLSDGDADPHSDGVAYRQISVWLSAEELEAFVERITVAIGEVVGNAPTSDRRSYLLSPILFPVPDIPPENE